MAVDCKPEVGGFKEAIATTFAAQRVGPGDPAHDSNIPSMGRVITLGNGLQTVTHSRSAVINIA
jgi:hypothetical protein